MPTCGYVKPFENVKRKSLFRRVGSMKKIGKYMFRIATYKDTMADARKAAARYRKEGYSVRILKSEPGLRDMRGMTEKQRAEMRAKYAKYPNYTVLIRANPKEKRHRYGGN